MTDALAQKHLHATLTEWIRCVRIFPSVVRGGDGSRVLEFPGVQDIAVVNVLRLAMLQSTTAIKQMRLGRRRLQCIERNVNVPCEHARCSLNKRVLQPLWYFENCRVKST